MGVGTTTLQARERRGHLALALGVGLVALAFALRLYRIHWHAIWNDEAYSVYLAQLGLAEMSAATAADIHPPLYYGLLHFWLRLAGSGEFAVRYLSVVPGVLAVPLLYVLGRQLGGRGLGLAAAAVAALSPFLVFYSQEARMYTLLVAFVTAAGCFAWKATQLLPVRTWLPGYVCASALALYTHFYSLLAIAGFNAAYLVLVLPAFRRRSGAAALAGLKSSTAGGALRALLIWLAAQLALLLIFAPWLPVLLQKEREYLSPGRGTPLDKMVVDAARAFAVGEALLEGALDWYVIASWGLAVVGVVLAAVLVRSGRLPGGVGRGSAFAATWLLIAFAAIALLSAGKRDFAPRYLAAGVPAFYLLLGLALLTLYRLWRPLPLLGAAAILAGSYLALGPLRIDPNNLHADHRAAIRDLEAMAQPGDVVVLNAFYTFPVFRYYSRGDLPYVGLPATSPPDRAETESALQDLAGRYSRIWVLYWQDYFTDAEGIVQSWLAANAFQFFEQPYLGWVRLRGYAVRPSGEVTFGGAAKLIGYELTPRAPKPGEQVRLTLYWRCLAPLDKDHQVFVHLVDADYKFVAQHDGPPAEGKAPTTIWSPGMTIVDQHTLQIAADAKPGEYDLRVGMYELATMARLRTGTADNLLVGKVKVAAP